MKRTGLYATTALLGVLVGAQPSYAQIEEITVTARKTTENLLQIPIAITAITAESLEDKGLEDRRDLTHYTPGFYFPPANNATASRLINTYTIRGLGAVNVFWNGVPLNGGDIPELLDLERVEVLKGPQNAYFGRSTFTGAINFIAKEPGSGGLHGYGEANIGTWGNKAFKAAVEDAIVPGILSARIGGSYRVLGAQYDNYGYGGKLGQQKTLAGTATVVFTPTDHAKLRAYYADWHDDDGPNGIHYGQTPADNNCNGGGVPTGLNYICGAQSKVNPARISQFVAFPPQAIAATAALATTTTVGPNYITYNGLKRDGRVGQIFGDYTFDNNWTASFIGSLMRNTVGQIQDYGNRFYNDNGATYNPSMTTYLLKDQYAEFRITADPKARLRGMLGASYDHATQNIQSVINKTGIISVSFPPTIIYSETAGVFGSVTYDIFDRLSATFEGRWQWDRVGRNTINVVDLSGSTRSFVPRAILEYFLNDEKSVNVFASYSEGTRPGAVNTGFLSLPAYAQAQVATQFSVPATVPEEKLHNYEAGLKGNFLDNRLRVLAGVYYAQDRGAQVPAALFYTNLQGVLAQANVTLGTGATNAWGTEWEFSLAPTEHLNIDGTFAWNHTKILTTACAVCRIITGNINPVGHSIARYPITSGTLGATYKWNAFSTSGGTDVEAYVRADAYYHGKDYADQTNLVWLKPYVITNLRIGLETGRYKFEVYGLNIFNNRIPQDIGQTPDQITGAQTISLTPQLKTTVGGKLNVKF